MRRMYKYADVQEKKTFIKTEKKYATRKKKRNKRK